MVNGTRCILKVWEKFDNSFFVPDFDLSERQPEQRPKRLRGKPLFLYLMGTCHRHQIGATPKPFSSLKKVTRSISPERLSAGRDDDSTCNGNDCDCPVSTWQGVRALA